MNERIYRKAANEAQRILWTIAKAHKTIPYETLAALLYEYGIKGTLDDNFRRILGAVSDASMKEHNVMLSALIVHKADDKRPGPGFYKLARELGKRPSGSTEEFWRKEVRKVYAVADSL